MKHAAQQVREAVATILSRNPVAWKSVIESRIASTRQIWPYLMVFVESETVQALTADDPCRYQREMILSVVGMLKLPGNGDTYTIEDRMDEASAEVEMKLTQAILRAEVQIGSLELVARSMDVILEDEGIDHAAITLSWKIAYFTLEGSPESLI